MFSSLFKKKTKTNSNKARPKEHYIPRQNIAKKSVSPATNSNLTYRVKVPPWWTARRSEPLRKTEWWPSGRLCRQKRCEPWFGGWGGSLVYEPLSPITTLRDEGSSAQVQSQHGCKNRKHEVYGKRKSLYYLWKWISMNF